MLPGKAIVRTYHRRSGDIECQETFLAPSAHKQTRNYVLKIAQTNIPPNHHELLGLSHSK